MKATDRTVKRRVFGASMSAALAGCGPIGTALNDNDGVAASILASVEPLNHALIGTRGLAREYRERDVDRDFRVNGFATPTDAHYARRLRTELRDVPACRRWRGRAAAGVFTLAELRACRS